MSTIDLSRQVSDRRKHYAGVRHQQGRVLTDDDFNEAAALETEELRRTRLHAIGAYGAPDSGFLPKDFAVAAGKLDFKLSTGELYLGGLRLEMNVEERFLEQLDWLNFDKAAAPAPPAAGATRTDLVWIEAWQQPITAVEDGELFEVALGGPDTSVRWRTMRRVHVLPDVTGGACPEAWASALAGFSAMGTLTAEMEIATAATLKVTFTNPLATGDLCAPPQAGGYLGAENQAIRVQMVDATHYCWGFNNASPLYRVKIGDKNGAKILVTMQTMPKDAAHWPLKDQVVELLPRSALLANHEPAADVAGHLCKVAVSYDPDEHTFELDVPLPPGFDFWKSRDDHADFFDGQPEHDFLYLRVWDRGDDLASPASIPIASGILGNTGLDIAFNGGPLRPADHWIIAARPAAPSAIVPWRLTLASGAPPNGIIRYRAPLGLIQWTGTGAGAATGILIDDCRPPFLPLTRIRGCCTVTVGDGIESFGMFSSIQDAIESLPITGGEVCVLPGLFREAVRLVGLRNVTLHGCGPRSRIVAPDVKGADSTAIAIVECDDICIERLAIEGGNQSVVSISDSRVVRVADCLIQFRDNGEDFSPWTAVFAHGRAIEIEDNIVEPLPEEFDRIFSRIAAPLRAGEAQAARGGVQLAGGCRNVRVGGNVITGGSGNGITLGSILRVDPDNPDGVDVPDIDEEGPCVTCDPTDSGAPPDDDGPIRYESGGDLYAIEISDNIITRQGANGISVVRFFGFGNEGLRLITVHGLRISGNRILACLRNPVATPTAALLLFLGYGGISLAFVTDLEVEGNFIARNGRDWLDPVCGLFALAVDGLRIEHNIIRGNGAPGEEPLESARPGIRAGIHIWLAFSLNLPSGDDEKDQKLESSSKGQGGVDQLRIHGNQVEQPLGRALFMLGAGPMHISDNRFVSEALAEKVTDPVARTVLVANFGISREWTLGLLLAMVFRILENSAKDLDLDSCTVAKLGIFTHGIWPRLPTGKLAFVDNQVSFLMRDAPFGFDLASTLLISFDDVSACDNQFEYHVDQRIALTDLMALGSTIRSSDNRLAETWGRAFSSALSFAIMNTACANQSTHCLRINGMKTAVADNLILAELFCDDICFKNDGVGARLATGAVATFNTTT